MDRRAHRGAPGGAQEQGFRRGGPHPSGTARPRHRARGQGRLDHLAHDDLSVYTAAQRAAYVALIIALVVMVASGLAIWKPVQLYWLASLMGDYEGARLLHFFAMAAVFFIVLVHVTMVVLVPRTFPTMFTGRFRRTS